MVNWGARDQPTVVLDSSLLLYMCLGRRYMLVGEDLISCGVMRTRSYMGDRWYEPSKRPFEESTYLDFTPVQTAWTNVQFSLTMLSAHLIRDWTHPILVQVKWMQCNNRRTYWNSPDKLPGHYPGWALFSGSAGQQNAHCNSNWEDVTYSLHCI